MSDHSDDLIVTETTVKPGGSVVQEYHIPADSPLGLKLIEYRERLEELEHEAIKRSGGRWV